MEGVNMLPKINWKKVTMREAIAIKANAEEVIEKRRDEEKARIQTEARKMAAEAGFKLTDIFDVGATPKRRKIKQKPRIYHPTDKTLSYGGYGPKPKWLKEMETA
jgi:hypothetical protein